MRLFPVLLASTLIAGAAAAAQPVAGGKPMYGAFGFDTAGMDRTVRPGDDFYAYASGTWQKQTEIPADRSSYGMFNKLNELSLARTRGILEGAAKTPGSRIGDFYASYMDAAAADAKGVAPIRPWLDAVTGAGDKAALAGEIAALQRIGVGTLFNAPGPFDSAVGPDDKDPRVNIFHLRQGGLGLPDRDYYLKPDAKLAEARGAYKAYLVTLLTLAGQGDAEARAGQVIAFETRLAQAHWTRVDSRDRDKSYNRWTIADFAAKAPGFDWAPFLTGLGVAGQPAILVAQPSAFAGEAQAWAATPLGVLRDHQLVHLLDDYAPYLSKPFVDARFAYRGVALTGQPEDQPRWKKGVTIVSQQMGEAVGQPYVAQYFPPAAKAAADTLVRNIIAAYRERLAAVPWMAPETRAPAAASSEAAARPETRAKALEKLAAFKPMIGYPDRWRDYSPLAVRRDDLVGNVSRGFAFDYQRNLDKLAHPVDRGEWLMDPMTVNAYAEPVMNVIVFPAAILQPPFFDPAADLAVNYGGIGVVIGHELSHHFDDQGRKYDKTGKLTDWWTPRDVSRFTALTDRLVRQYDAYEPLPGTHVQGALTLGENMADLAGLTVSRQAYTIALAGTPAPVIGGFTGDQRFYLGYAQIWRTKYRDPALRRQLLTDPHSPGTQRTDEVRNQDAWYAAFGVQPAAALYLPPADRVKVW